MAPGLTDPSLVSPSRTFEKLQACSTPGAHVADFVFGAVLHAASRRVPATCNQQGNTAHEQRCNHGTFNSLQRRDAVRGKAGDGEDSRATSVKSS